MTTSSPKAIDLLLGTAWLAMGMWHASDGDELLGFGFALLGVATFAAGFFPRVHDFMYRPIWSRRR
jgi:hypothetical protein